MEPLRQWASELQRESSAHLEQARSLLKVLGGSAARRVLVVDDDEFSQKVVARILEREGYEVIFAGSGTEALNLLRKVRPSVILMDYMLPDQDGVQSSRDTVIRSLAAGAVDFVTKPISPNVLLAKVGKYIEL